MQIKSLISSGSSNTFLITITILIIFCTTLYSSPSRDYIYLLSTWLLLIILLAFRQKTSRTRLIPNKFIASDIFIGIFSCLILLNLFTTSIQDLTMLNAWKYFAGVAIYIVYRSEKIDLLWSLLEPILIALGIIGLMYCLFDVVRNDREINGQFLDSNLFSDYLLFILIPIAMYFLTNSLSPSRSKLYLLFIFCLFFAVTLTNSRGGILIWLGSMVLITYFAYKHKILIVKNLILLGVVSALSWVSYYIFSTLNNTSTGYSYSSIISATDSSPISVRLMLWRSSLQMYQDFPYFGSGLGTYPILYRSHRSSDEFYTRGSAAHNDLLQMLVEGGPLLAIAMLGLIAIVGWRAARYLLQRQTNSDKDMFNEAIKFSLLVVIISFSIHGSINFALTNISLFMIACFFLALTTPGNKSNESRKQHARPSKNKLASTFLLVVVGYFLLTDLAVDNIYNLKSKSRNLFTLVDTNNHTALYSASTMLTLLRPDKTYPRAYLIRTSINALENIEDPIQRKQLTSLIEKDFSDYLESCRICHTSVSEYADFHEKYGDQNIALKNYKKLTVLEPHNIGFLLQYSDALAKHGHPEDAINIILDLSDKRINFANRMTQKENRADLYKQAIFLAKKHQFLGMINNINTRFQ